MWLIIQFIYDIYSIEQLKPNEVKILNKKILNCKSYFSSKINENQHQKTGFSITQIINDYSEIIISNDTISYDIINEILYCYLNNNLSENKIDSKAAYILSKFILMINMVHKALTNQFVIWTFLQIKFFRCTNHAW